jgi:hypothetical protein
MEADSTRVPKVGGPLDSTRHIYIARHADDEFIGYIRAGEFVNLITSRQMGKTSLVYRAIEELTPAGYHFAYCDLSRLRNEPDAHRFFATLVEELQRDLGVVVQPNQDDRLKVASERLMSFLRNALNDLTGPIVIVLDEIDSTLESTVLQYTDDLFTTIRSIYTARPRNKAFERLSFCLVGVATPNELVKARRTTPYNVGRTIWLADFSPERDDLRPLVGWINADPVVAEHILTRILYWTDGQPYLTMLMCDELSRRGANNTAAVDALVNERFGSVESVRGDTHFDSIERIVNDRARDSSKVLALYQRIQRGDRVIDQPASLTYAHLKLSGLVKRDANGLLITRNRIYDRVFDREWVETSKPLQVIQKARRLTYIAAAVLAVVVGIVVFIQTAVAPSRDRAARALAELETTPNEMVAEQQFRLLTNPSSRWFAFITRDYQASAQAALQKFSERRARTLEEQADALLKGQREEEACVTIAAAALKRRSESVGAFWETLCNGPKFQRLLLSIRGLYADTRLAAAIQPEFSEDGTRILVGMWLQDEPIYLLDASTGTIIWRQKFKGQAVLLADQRTIIEIGSDNASVWQRDLQNSTGATKRFEVSLGSGLGVAASYQATSKFFPVRRTDDATVESSSRVLRGVSSCLSSVFANKRSGTNLTSFGISNDGHRAGFVDDLRSIYVCDIERGMAKRILTYGGTSGGGFATLDFNNAGTLFTTSVGIAGKWGTIVVDVASGKAVRQWPDEAWAQYFLDAKPWLVLPERILSVTDWSEVYRGRILGTSPDGRVAVIQPRESSEGQGGANRLAVVELPSGRNVAEWQVLRQPNQPMVAFSQSADRVITGGDIIRVWNARAEKSQTSVSVPPEERWRSWQLKFGLTLDKNDVAIPLNTIAGQR